MKKFLYLLLVGAIIIGIWVYIVPHNVYTGELNYLSKLDKNINIKIRRYPIPRKIHWSGIFPFYGGLIDDPHILYSPVRRLPKEMLNILQLQNGRVQGFAVNPFFDIKYYTLIIALELDGIVYQIKIDSKEKLATFQVGETNTIIPFILEGMLCFYISDKEPFIIQTQYSQDRKSIEALQNYTLYEKGTEKWKQTIEILKQEKNIDYFIKDLFSARKISASKLAKMLQEGK